MKKEGIQTRKRKPKASVAQQTSSSAAAGVPGGLVQPNPELTAAIGASPHHLSHHSKGSSKCCKSDSNNQRLARSKWLQELMQSVTAAAEAIAEAPIETSAEAAVAVVPIKTELQSEINPIHHHHDYNGTEAQIKAMSSA